MVYRPNRWDDDNFGGYLDNTNKKVSLITGSTHHNHIVENKVYLYKAINYLNSLRFKVNNLLLDYLNNEGNYLLTEIKSENELQRIITLKVSETYKDIPFYLNVNADWRGRIYTQSFFLSYQGGDLSSALLNFWNEEPLFNPGKYHLYIHGANNHNENNLSKESFDNRVNWIK